MRRVFVYIGRKISTAIDFFYPIFGRSISLQFFRYGVSGASNMVFDWVVYFTMYNFVLKHNDLNLFFVTLSSPIAAFALTFPISFSTGFLLQKYVTFTTSDLRGRVQLFRYGLVVFVNLLINYVGLKIFVDVLGFFPTPSKMIVTVFTTLFSFFSQKKFTFTRNSTIVRH
jgi:putative flippase GtrA